MSKESTMAMGEYIIDLGVMQPKNTSISDCKSSQNTHSHKARITELECLSKLMCLYICCVDDDEAGWMRTSYKGIKKY